MQLVEKEIEGGNPPVPDNDEISPGIGRSLTRAARYPSDATGVMQFLRFGCGRVSEVRMGCPDHARNSINLVSAPVNAPRFVEHAVLSEDVIDGLSSACGVALAEYEIDRIAGVI